MAQQSHNNMYRAGPSKNHPLDDILPQQRACDRARGIPAIGNLLSDLQSGLEWNICTTPTKEGGYCIKFTTNRSQSEGQRHPQVNKNEMMGVSRTYQKMTRSKEVQATLSKASNAKIPPEMVFMSPEEAAQFAPSTASVSQKETKQTAKKQKSEKMVPTKAVSSAPAVSKTQDNSLDKDDVHILEEKELERWLSMAEISETGFGKAVAKGKSDMAKVDNDVAKVDKVGEQQADLVAEALDAQRDSDRPAMLVCVLLGPSIDLMKISNVVQEQAKERGVTVRMNAPMH